MSDAAKNTNAPETKGFRSPPYPFISLPKAIERVKTLHSEAQHHPVPSAVLGKAWGYSAKSSGLLQTAAALIQFGLMTDEGSGDKRRFQLTNEALRIVQDADPQSEKRKTAVVRAALRPKIHQELWGKFKGSTGDIVLKNYLTLDRREAGQAPYSETSANDLINEYKATIAYAELDKNAGLAPHDEGIIQGQNGDGNGDFAENPPPPPPPAWQGMPPPPPPVGQVKVMQGERVIFTEEESPQQHLRLVAAGELNEYLLEALEDFIKRQKKRLNIA